MSAVAGVHCGQSGREEEKREETQCSEPQMKKLGLWDPLRKRGRPERRQPRTLVCDAAQNLKTVLSSFYAEEGGVKSTHLQISLLPALRKLTGPVPHLLGRAFVSPSRAGRSLVVMSEHRASGPGVALCVHLPFLSLLRF